MKSWVITIPKTVPWEVYEKELAKVADGKSVMNYRVAQMPKDLRFKDRCYVVWNGRVRGWMEVVGTRIQLSDGWICSTTGTIWPPGRYVLRSGPFHYVDGPEMKGFRGIRRYDPQEDSGAGR